MLLNGASNQRHERVQSFSFERAVAADVVDAVGNRRLIEKRHPPQMREHPRMRFREERHIDGMSAGRCVVEAGLIGQDRLACPGRPLDDVDTRDEESPLKDAIQTLDAGRPAFRRWSLFVQVKSLRCGRDRLPIRTSRKHHRETRALSEGTVNGHRAAHRDADVPHNPESDAEAATPLLDTSFKALEDLRLLLGSNADAMVANRNAGEIVIGLDRDFNGTSCAESNRVGQEVSANLFDPQPIPHPCRCALCRSTHRATASSASNASMTSRTTSARFIGST